MYLKYQLCLDRENPFSPGTESGESVFLYLRAAAHDPPSRVIGLLNTTVRPPKLVTNEPPPEVSILLRSPWVDQSTVYLVPLFYCILVLVSCLSFSLYHPVVSVDTFRHIVFVRSRRSDFCNISDKTFLR